MEVNVLESAMISKTRHSERSEESLISAFSLQFGVR